jgi:diaminohydroxyphosphoribosylaminopyrimidine deaminase/5-amino-6-(5-phosphoribosylamino)uracil reductase
MTDHLHMARAIQLAQKGLYTTDPNPRVGCVVVKNNQRVGEGWHKKAGAAHAEIHALQQAGDKAQGSTVYVTLEPCSHYGRTPPCAEALIKAGVSRLVVAMQDPNPLVAGKGLQALQSAGIEVDCGVLEQQARQLNPGFIKRMAQGLPYVRVKLAMSLDGRTAMASGESKWISGEPARVDVQYLRARSSAILTGSATLLADDPSMNLRLSAAELGIDDTPRQPLRVVVDNQLSCPENARLFALAGSTLLLTALDSQHWQAWHKQKQRLETVQLAAHQQRIDLHEALRFLASREINEVHVEAGHRLCGALLTAGLVDEMIIYMAPHIMGDGARGLLHLPELKVMKQRIDLEIKDIRPIGKDWRITALPIYK